MINTVIKFEANLTAGDSQEITIPEGYTQAIFSYGKGGGDVNVNFFQLATSPTGTLIQTKNDLNPTWRNGLIGGQQISLIAVGSNCLVNVMLGSDDLKLGKDRNGNVTFALQAS